MHEDEFTDLALAVITGVVVGVTMVVLVERIPTVTVNTLYIQIQYGVFAALVGILPAVRYKSKTARGNLTTVSLFIACVATVGGFLMSNSQPKLLLTYLAVSVVVAVVTVAGAYFDFVPAEVLFNTSLLLTAMVYSFIVLYLILLQLQEGFQTYIVLIPLATLAYYATAKGTRKELTAVSG